MQMDTRNINRTFSGAYIVKYYYLHYLKRRHSLNISINQMYLVLLIILCNLDLLCLHSAVRGGILRKGFVGVGGTLNINMSSPKAPPRGF